MVTCCAAVRVWGHDMKSPFSMAMYSEGELQSAQIAEITRCWFTIAVSHPSRGSNAPRRPGFRTSMIVWLFSLCT